MQQSVDFEVWYRCPLGYIYHYVLGCPGLSVTLRVAVCLLPIILPIRMIVILLWIDLSQIIGLLCTGCFLFLNIILLCGLYCFCIRELLHLLYLYWRAIFLLCAGNHRRWRKHLLLLLIISLGLLLLHYNFETSWFGVVWLVVL